MTSATPDGGPRGVKEGTLALKGGLKEGTLALNGRGFCEGWLGVGGFGSAALLSKAGTSSSQLLGGSIMTGMETRVACGEGLVKNEAVWTGTAAEAVM